MSTELNDDKKKTSLDRSPSHVRNIREQFEQLNKNNISSSTSSHTLNAQVKPSDRNGLQDVKATFQQKSKNRSYSDISDLNFQKTQFVDRNYLQEQKKDFIKNRREVSSNATNLSTIDETTTNVKQRRSATTEDLVNYENKTPLSRKDAFSSADLTERKPEVAIDSVDYENGNIPLSRAKAVSFADFDGMRYKVLRPTTEKYLKAPHLQQQSNNYAKTKNATSRHFLNNNDDMTFQQKPKKTPNDFQQHSSLPGDMLSTAENVESGKTAMDDTIIQQKKKPNAIDFHHSNQHGDIMLSTAENVESGKSVQTDDDTTVQQKKKPNVVYSQQHFDQSGDLLFKDENIASGQSFKNDKIIFEENVFVHIEKNEDNDKSKQNAHEKSNNTALINVMVQEKNLIQLENQNDVEKNLPTKNEPVGITKKEEIVKNGNQPQEGSVLGRTTKKYANAFYLQRYSNNDNTENGEKGNSVRNDNGLTFQQKPKKTPNPIDFQQHSNQSSNMMSTAENVENEKSDKTDNITIVQQKKKPNAVYSYHPDHSDQSKNDFEKNEDNDKNEQNATVETTNATLMITLLEEKTFIQLEKQNDVEKNLLKKSAPVAITETEKIVENENHPQENLFAAERSEPLSIFEEYDEEESEEIIPCISFDDEPIELRVKEKLNYQEMEESSDIHFLPRRSRSSITHSTEIFSFDFHNVKIGPKMFRRQKSSTNTEFSFEVNIIIYLVLNLLPNKDYEDFNLSTKNHKYGTLGEVILKLKLKDGKQQKFAMLLKYAEEDTTLPMEIFSDSESDFSLVHYCRQYHNLERDSTSLKHILCTNRTFKNHENLETVIQDEDDVIAVQLIDYVFDLEVLNFVKTNTIPCRSFKFEIIEEKCRCSSEKLDEYKTFFDNFIVTTNFLEVAELEERIRHGFKGYSRKNNAYYKFLQFIETWNAKEGAVTKISKFVVTEMIALSLVSPYIKIFPGASIPLSTNEIHFKNATSEFQVTIISSKHIDKVKKLWPSVCSELPDLQTLQQDMCKHEIISKIQRIEDLKDEEIAIALWLIGKYPLILDDNKDVRKALTLCQNTNLKFILLGENVAQYNWRDVFDRLSDLEEKSLQLYEDLIKNYMYILQGKQMSLKTLMRLTTKDLAEVITPNELICLADNSLSFHDEEVPPVYINRVLPKVIINVHFLESVNDDTFVVITSYDKKSTIKDRFDAVEYKEERNETTKRVFVCENELDSETWLLTEEQFHWFRFVDNDHLEWVKSQIDDITTLRAYQNHIPDYYDESMLVHHEEENNINLLCGEAGIGKTSLMKNLQRSGRSVWTVFIQPKNHFQHFSKNKTGDLEMFKTYLIAETCKDLTTFENHLLQTFVYKKLVRFIWDDLDQVSGDVLKTVMSVIQQLAKEGSKQWLISRNSLKTKLENRYKVLARGIKMLSEEDQNGYIQERLHVSPKDLQRQRRGWTHSFMEVPLHLFIFTELLLRDTENYSDSLSQVLTIPELYDHFVDCCLADQDTESNQTRRSYEKVGAYFHFKEVLSSEECSEVLEFLEEIKTKKCDFVNREDFVHRFLGEYFAVSYLLSNVKKCVQVKQLLIEPQFRYLFDVMASSSSRAHRAVLLQDLDLLKSCTAEELQMKDQIGRHALHLACGYGTQYPLLRVIKQDDNLIIDDTAVHFQKLKPESENYIEMIEFLAKKCDPRDNDLFDLDCFSYADSHNCFVPMALLRKHFTIYFNALQEAFINVLYYSVRFDIDEFFEMEERIPLVQSKRFKKSFLSVAFKFKSDKCVEKMLSCPNSSDFVRELNTYKIVST